MTAIRTLMWKDWGVYRLPIVASGLILVLLYVLAYYRVGIGRPYARGVIWSEWLYWAGHAGLYWAALMAAVFGGMSFAAERRERSADFVAMMPVTRGQIILSKLVIAVGCVALLWLINLGVILVGLGANPDEYQWWFGQSSYRFTSRHVQIAGVLVVMIFGLSWMLSSFLTSPAIAACIAIGCTAALYILLAFATFASEAWRLIFLSGAAAIGLLGIAVGSLIYHRRIAP